MNAKYNLIIYRREENLLSSCLESLLQEGCSVVARVSKVEEVDSYSYDYVICCEEIGTVKPASCVNEKWLFMHEFIFLLEGFGFDIAANITRFLESEPHDTIVTGLSYMQFGISPEYFAGVIGNLANPGQDLYTDLGMLKWACERDTSIRKCILGIAPYSFRYDLSLSRNKYRSLQYIPYIGDAHHHPQGKAYVDLFRSQKSHWSVLLVPNHLRILLDIYREANGTDFSNKKTGVFAETAMTQQEKQTAEAEIYKLFHKPYEATLDENLDLFNQILHFLSTNQIRPVVVLAPFPELVRRNLPQELYQETLGILQEYQNYYEFDVLDLTYSEEFQDADYYDWSHLNVTGQEKMSKMVSTVFD